MDASVDAHANLQQLLQEQSAFFLGIINAYVARTDLAWEDSVQNVALAVWQETALEALAHIERFAEASQPRAWVLAVATNVLKRKRHELVRRSRYELSISKLLSRADDREESAFFEQVTALAMPGPEQEVETSEQVNEMLALVSLEDQRVLRLAFLHDLDGQMLANALRVSPSTARSRLHRALARLRLAWAKSEQNRKEA